jgi:hypothetical protein
MKEKNLNTCAPNNRSFGPYATGKAMIHIPLPFTFSFIAVARFFDGGRSGKYEALGLLAMAVLSFVVGVCWDRILGKRASATSP